MSILVRRTTGQRFGFWQRLAAAGAAVLGVALARAQDIVPAAGADVAYRFTAADEALLERVQHGCFLFFWREVGSPSGLAKDRRKGPVSSIAAVGFQLSSLPIGVERGWITRDEGRQRATSALTSLLERDDNKKFGVYLHFPDLNTGGMSHEGYEIVASTVDHALLLAGALTAGEYFGGEVAALADRMAAETNWKAFAVAPNGYISMGWRPDDKSRMDGPGSFLEWHWWSASDEERLVYLLAVGAPTPEHAVLPEMYYRLQRNVRQHKELPPFVVSWPGTLFTYFFSHCWIDYRALGPDSPQAFGVAAPRVDWFENSRRAVLTHRARCIEESARYKTLAEDRWGLSACAARDGYIVPHIRPNLADQDELHEGTIAPYAAASAIMFTPAESMAAIRAFYELRGPGGERLVWRDPAEGGYGFVDSFNLEQGWVEDDCVGIDQGPMLVAIENVRTGLAWKLFMKNAHVRRALERLKLTPEARP